MSAAKQEENRRRALARTAAQLRAESARNGRPTTQTQALARVMQADRKRED